MYKLIQVCMCVFVGGIILCIEYVYWINAHIMELTMSYFSFITELQSFCKYNVFKRITKLLPKFEV